MGYNKRTTKEDGRTEYLINNVIDMGVYPINIHNKS